MVRLALTLAAALVLLAACADDAEGPEAAAVPAAPDAAAPAVPTPATETAAPSVTPEAEGAADAPEAIEAAARALLADETGVAETAFSLDSAMGVTWSDASLGCPQEGFGYAQVLTPGYKLLFSRDGAVYAVHTNVDGSHAVVCENAEMPETAVAPETEGSSGAPEPVQAAARALLADETGVAESALSLDSAEAVEWSDTSLGCPQEGFAYAQVLTPGYKLLFSHQGTAYPVHTNNDGSHAVVCEDGG